MSATLQKSANKTKTMAHGELIFVVYFFFFASQSYCLNPLFHNRCLTIRETSKLNADERLRLCLPVVDVSYYSTLNVLRQQLFTLNSVYIGEYSFISVSVE